MFLPPPTYHEPDEPTTGSERPSKYAVLFGILACSNLWRVVDTLPMTNLWSIPALLIVAKAVLGAAAWMYIWMFTDLFVWPAFVTWWNSGDPKSEQPAKNAPQAPQQPKREPTPVPAPRINTRLNGGGNGEAREVEQTAVQPSSSRILVGNRYVDLSEYDVGLDQWNLVVMARRRGKMSTISPTMLKEKFGVDNLNETETRDSDARRLIDMLESIGLIENTGYRQPYRFTQLGERVLPASPANGVTTH